MWDKWGNLESAVIKKTDNPKHCHEICSKFVHMKGVRYTWEKKEGRMDVFK